MDRAHRLGQTRQVTVYRLITRGTIDERIVQLARVKKDVRFPNNYKGYLTDTIDHQVQDIVVGNKQFTDVTKPNEIVSLLLNDDELANLESQGSSASVSKKAGKKAATGATDETSQAVRDLWQEEGDDFFGQGGATAAPNSTDGVEEESSTPAPVGTTGTRGKKRRGPGGGTRGRKPGPAKGSKRKVALPDEF